MAPGERFFDAFLLSDEPIERRIKFFLINCAKFEYLSERASGGLLIEQAPRRPAWSQAR